ncbi:MAG: DUF885 domain-containing protein [Anaerolineae bacterium]|jgi:uncharacterized protein (DUF885 family)
MQTQAPAFGTWLDEFFAAYYRRRPVNATFIGLHQYDDLLPDFSDEGAGDTSAEMERLLTELRTLPPETLSQAEAIDRKLAGGFLQIQLWEYSSQHFHLGNPSLYTGEAIFGILPLFLTNFAPLAERVESAVARMEAIPQLLSQGKTNVRHAPLAWTERAIRECTGALDFLQGGVEQLIHDEGIDGARMLEAAAKATSAFVEFQEYLETELIARTTDSYGCGEEAFDLMMRQGHFVDMRAEEIARYGEEQMAEAQAYLDEHAADFGAATWREALAQLSDLHPTIDNYYDSYTKVWDACRTTAESHALVTWPDFPIRYVPRPAWSREAAPYLYFLFYRSPAAYNRPPVHDYLVAPIDLSLPAEEQEKLLRANNDSAIKLNHVVHHGSIGHHVQNWYAFRAASRIGRVAAVDCASRIAMFCGGTMAEGWAVYATELMGEVGFLTPLELYAEHQGRRRMSARAIVDVRLHQGRFTLDEAATFYEQRAGMSPGAARGEAVKNSMFPGAAMMYLIGTDRIKTLRREMARRWGRDFSLRRFHDQFLSYGSIPVALIAEEMEGEDNDA